MTLTHIVRFKVVTVDCVSMPNGQQYTIYYRRGDTRRSSPCYIAQNGIVDFSAMPEGAAIVHFKRGEAGRRYAPKFIQMRVEEYNRGTPRRTVGETEVDCSLVLTGHADSGSGIVAVSFRMFGIHAKLRVAILVYPERAPPLTFDGLVTPSQTTGNAEEPLGEVKVMGRREAMALLISLETMLERRKNDAGKENVVTSKLEQRLNELEERRKALAGSEGMATGAITARCQSVVEAQFVALRYKYRRNFVGATAAYLRQLDLSSGAPRAGEEAEVDEATTQEQLARTSRRLNELQDKIRKLEEEQSALGRIQHKTDVTQELCANLDKMAAVMGQVKILEQSRSALEAALNKKKDQPNTPLNREVKDINDRIAVVLAEQDELHAKVKHMTSVAAGHILHWARAKNPPTPEPPQTDVEDLFSDAEKAKPEGNNFDEVQRKQLMQALQGLKPSAPPHQVDSDSSSSGHHTPRDLYGATGLPSMGDFGPKKLTATKAPADPLRPSGLGAEMFSPRSEPKPVAQSLPTIDFSAKPSAANRKADREAPMFDFNAIASQAYADNPTVPSGYSIEQTPVPLGSTAATSSATVTPTATLTGSAPANKFEDPYYDDIDDYTVPPETSVKTATVEFTGGFEGFTEEVHAPAPAEKTYAPGTASAEKTYAPGTAPRPTFNFGPGEDGGSAGGGGFELDVTSAVDFGSPSDAPSGSAQGTRPSGYRGLPEYNFSS